MSDWITVEDVALYLDLPGAADDNLTASTAAAKAAVERRRADLDYNLADTFRDVHADVWLGAVIWAGLIYQTRNAPSGFSGYGDETQLYDALGARRAEVMRLLGWRRPVVA